jgi:phosphoglucomutase
MNPLSETPPVRLARHGERPTTPGATGISPLAGRPAPRKLLVDAARLEREYFERRPDLEDSTQLVSFGASGRRGSPLRGTFTESHILAITQAICDFRKERGTDGPLYMGKDTHALSAPAERTALEVLATNGVRTVVQEGDGVTPTPVISRTALVCNRGRRERLADGIVFTPSHNPPEDGGFKYHLPHGGPADTDVTHGVQTRANELQRAGNSSVKRVPFAQALDAPATHQQDLMMPYVRGLEDVWIWTRSAPPGSRWRWTRWAARRSLIGRRSTPPTGWTWWW